MTHPWLTSCSMLKSAMLTSPFIVTQALFLYSGLISFNNQYHIPTPYLYKIFYNSRPIFQCIMFFYKFIQLYIFYIPLKNTMPMLSQLSCLYCQPPSIVWKKGSSMPIQKLRGWDQSVTQIGCSKDWGQPLRLIGLVSDQVACSSCSILLILTILSLQG